MKNLKILTLTLLFVSVSFAQYNPNAEYWITYQYTPKKGMTAKFESAVKAKTKISVTIECVAPFDLEGVKIPARNILPDRCPFIYQGAGDHVDNFIKP